jgi:hypothetical protein
MMPQLIETHDEGKPGPACTREQARELLEGLRAAYQSLPLADRSLIKGLIHQTRRAQGLTEMDQENECCESVS